jgi:hypothetical protein
MSKVYTKDDLFVGMRLRYRNSDDIWEIDVIDFDIDFVGISNPLVRLPHRRKAGLHYHSLISSLNKGDYIEVTEQTFEIKT